MQPNTIFSIVHIAMDFVADRVSYSNQNLNRRNDDEEDAEGNASMSADAAKKQFREFIRGFTQGRIYPYRVQLEQRFRKRQYWLEVNLEDLQQFSHVLLELLQRHPAVHINLFEQAAREVLLGLLHSAEETSVPLPEIQIIIKSSQEPIMLRHLAADHISRLLKIPGVVTSASRVSARAKTVKIQCQKCKTTKYIPCASGMAGLSIPQSCDQGGADVEGGAPAAANCGPDPYVVLPDESTYIDQQSLKLQEAPDVVPTGEMPRHILVTVDRHLVDKVSPGTRVCIMGVASLFHGSAKKQLGNQLIRTTYIKAVGVEVQNEGAGRASDSYTTAEEELFKEMSKRPNIYTDMASSIAPSISGDYTVDIKKALACQLFGGSRKVLPDGTRLRGDINVLLLGDPSTAKSQFLKFVERVAPVGVYTSGKGSSAAGLTASVVKNAQGEFYLEGGAMVLADGGIVCIDEFDKMRENDRVAIHEAMEQQSISIAKAGITTILNSRTSVLAAANPIFGRYDDSKGTGENIDLMTTILSRFDLIFVVRDLREEERDRSIAQHVMGVHIQASTNRGRTTAAREDQNVDLKTMKKYIGYCRATCSPRLSEAAGAKLVSYYTGVREELRKRIITDGAPAQTIPITVRQLEALARISESLAKMRLAAEATEEDVEEAFRLFNGSTMQAAKQGHNTGLGGLTAELVVGAEGFLKQRIATRSQANRSTVIDEAIKRGHTGQAVAAAINNMVRKGDLVEKNKGKLLMRLK